MKNFSLGPDEALLFEGSADRKKSNDKHTRQTNIYLTNLNMIFEFVPPKIFGRGEVEIESFPVSDIKIYNGEPQIKNNGGEVKVFFTDHEEELTFDERKKARQFTNTAFKLITGKDLGDRGADAVRSGIAKIDSALGINTTDTVVGIIENGMIKSIVGGIKGKRGSKGSSSEAVDMAKKLLAARTEKEKPKEIKSADVTEKLKQLKDLLDSGIITQDEFETKKQELMKDF